MCGGLRIACYVGKGKVNPSQACPWDNRTHPHKPHACIWAPHWHRPARLGASTVTTEPTEESHGITPIRPLWGHAAALVGKDTDSPGEWRSRCQRHATGHRTILLSSHLGLRVPQECVRPGTGAVQLNLHGGEGVSRCPRSAPSDCVLTCHCCCLARVPGSSQLRDTGASTAPGFGLRLTRLHRGRPWVAAVRARPTPTVSRVSAAAAALPMLCGPRRGRNRATRPCQSPMSGAVARAPSGMEKASRSPSS